MPAVALTTNSIFKLAEDFVKNSKNANNLAHLIENLSHNNELDSKLTNCCILGLQTMFSHSLPVKKHASSGSKKENAANEEFRTWLLKKHEETVVILLRIVKNTKQPYAVREQAMITYMHMLKLESMHIEKPEIDDVFCLPKMKFMALLKALVSTKKGKATNSKTSAKLINRFSEFLNMHDVALQTWVTSVTLCKIEKRIQDETKMKNILLLIGKTVVPSSELRDKSPSDVFLTHRAHQLPKKLFKKAPKAIDGVWNHIKKWHHTETTLHTTLLLLLEKIMENLSEPKLLTDFLMNSLNYGGALSLLSLQGIFNLIQKHNIEYPNIYAKLYSLFTPEILHTKYKQRLFYLADLFLTSTHLPEGLVAAFAKRLGRLALTANTTDVLIIIPFIGNLLIRHKGLQKMIHGIEGGFVDIDPFLENEPEPLNSRAVDSCLWEIKSLQSHLVPTVAIAARFIDEKIPAVEWDLADVLEIKFSEIFEKEVNKKAKELSLNFVPPTPEVLEKLQRTF